MKRFKEFKLSRGWRVTVRRPECLMEVPPVLGVRASGTGQLYEHRLHLARYWLQVLYGAYCVGGSANTVGTPLCKRTLGWLQPWVCTSVITWKKKKKERKKKNLWRQLSFAASQRLECYWLKETWLTANKNSEKSLCVGWGREREKKSFHRRASFKKKNNSPSRAEVRFAMGGFLLFRPGLPTCSLRWARLPLWCWSHSASQHEGEKTPPKKPPDPMNGSTGHSLLSVILVH